MFAHDIHNNLYYSHNGKRKKVPTVFLKYYVLHRKNKKATVILLAFILDALNLLTIILN